MRGIEAMAADYQQERETQAYRGKGVMLMRTKTIRSGDYLECEIFPVVQMESGQRQRLGKRSPEAIRLVNERNAIKHLERLMNANFGPGDLLPHLTMARSCAYTEMQTEMRRFIRRIKGRAKKRGAALKYIYVIETTGEGEKARHHAHMVVSARGEDGEQTLTRDEIEQLWGNGLSRVDRVQRQEKGLCGFARYITQRKVTQKRLAARRWGASKGLRNPDREAKTSDRAFSRAACRKIAQAAEEDARALFEKKYPGYRLVEMPVIRYSEWLPGCYIYAFLERTGSPCGGLRFE